MPRTWRHDLVAAAAADYFFESGARRLCLYHHDPSHTDDDLDALHEDIRAIKGPGGPREIIGAHEGLQIQL